MISGKMISDFFLLVNCYFTVFIIVAVSTIKLQLVPACPCYREMINLIFLILIGEVFLCSRYFPTCTITNVLIFHNWIIWLYINYLVLVILWKSWLLFLGRKFATLTKHSSAIFLFYLLMVEKIRCLHKR